MKNNFIQMAAFTDHAVAYTIGTIFKHIADCVQQYFTNGFTNIVLNCLWVVGVTLIFDATSQIIVQRCQIANPMWPNDISFAADNNIIGHNNPTFRIIDLVSHTTYVVCVNFIHKCRDLQFKVDSERQICFWETFHGNFISHSEFLPEICWKEIAEEILFVFRFDVWPGTRTLAFRLISQHTTY